MTFSATAAGTCYAVYLVTDGPSATLGLIRVDVAVPAPSDEPPVAVRDRALLPSAGSVLVDVLANDSDPCGGVLVVQSVDIGSGAGVSVSVVDHAYVRVTAVRTGSVPFTFTYTVSNGAASATGEVLVVPLPAVGSLQPPVATDDEVTVRAGDVVTIPVLANDTHPNGAPLTLDPDLTDVSGIGSGQVFTSGDTVRFLAGPDAGTAYATYTVRDPQDNKDSAQVTIHIKAVDARTNSAPQPRTVTARLVAGGTVRVAIPLDGIDPDGDSVQPSSASRAPRSSCGLLTRSATGGSTSRPAWTRWAPTRSATWSRTRSV